MKYAITLSTAALALVLGAAAAHAQAQRTPAPDSVPAAASATDGSHTRRERPNRNVLTADQIAATHVSTAWEVVARLRPRWLEDRVVTEFNVASGPVQVQVHRNGQEQSDGLLSLRGMPADNIATIEWLPPMVARVRYGPRATHGAIVITDKH